MAETVKVEIAMERVLNLAILILKQTRYKEYSLLELWVALKVVRLMLERNYKLVIPEDVEREVDAKLADWPCESV